MWSLKCIYLGFFFDQALILKPGFSGSLSLWLRKWSKTRTEYWADHAAENFLSTFESLLCHLKANITNGRVCENKFTNKTFFFIHRANFFTILIYKVWRHASAVSAALQEVEHLLLNQLSSQCSLIRNSPLGIVALMLIPVSHFHLFESSRDVGEIMELNLNGSMYWATVDVRNTFAIYPF